jgi:hypothetical protein
MVNINTNIDINALYNKRDENNKIANKKLEDIKYEQAKEVLDAVESMDIKPQDSGSVQA